MITITIDGEDYSIPPGAYVPADVLRVAELDPARHYLVRIANGRQIASYKDVHWQIPVSNTDEFISVFTGPTTLG